MAQIRIDEQGRPEPPQQDGDAATMLGFLDYQRATLEWKCRGLSDDQLRMSLPPASMTLGGMLKHAAYIEDYWFSQTAAGQPVPEPWASADYQADPDWEWHSAAGNSGEGLRALWADRVGRSRAAVNDRLGEDAAGALDRSYPAWGGEGQVSLRWIILHMIEEYARHNGHADLIRESIDGQTGE